MAKGLSTGTKAILSLLLAIFLYIAIPTWDDLITIPILSYLFRLSLLTTIILYYGIAWVVVIVLNKVLLE